MDEASFWGIISAARDYGARFDDTFDGRVEGLATELRELAPDQIQAFSNLFVAKQEDAYTHELTGAALLLGSGCSDDGFTDFRTWLISMGRTWYERALEEPDSLAEVPFGPGAEQDCFFESFAYVALEVYEELTGRELPLPPRGIPPIPRRKPWEDGDLASRFPRLWRAAKEAGRR